MTSTDKPISKEIIWVEPGAPIGGGKGGWCLVLHYEHGDFYTLPLFEAQIDATMAATKYDCPFGYLAMELKVAQLKAKSDLDYALAAFREKIIRIYENRLAELSKGDEP